MTTYSPQTCPIHDCVSAGPMRRNSGSAIRKAQPGLLESSMCKTHCRLAWGIHLETGPHAPPALSFFGLLSRNFLTQPCCEPLFNCAYSGFCRNCCHLENTLSIYKEEAGCEKHTSMSLLLATSSKFSCCSKVLSTLSSVMQKQRKLDSTGSFILANITNFAI